MYKLIHYTKKNGEKVILGDEVSTKKELNEIKAKVSARHGDGHLAFKEINGDPAFMTITYKDYVIITTDSQYIVSKHHQNTMTRHGSFSTLEDAIFKIVMLEVSLKNNIVELKNLLSLLNETFKTILRGVKFENTE